MGDDFWAPIFAKLHEDLGFLRLLCLDTADADLLNWVLPNRPLAQRCNRFIRKHKITEKSGLIDEIIDYSRSDQALRKIILFTWVEKNPVTMGFVSLPANSDNIARLQAGDFGRPAKISILSRIDPRAGVEKIYQQYFEQHAGKDTVSNEPATISSTESTTRLQEAVDRATRAVKRSRELENSIETVKADNRQLKKQLETREKEVALLNRTLEETSHRAKAAEAAVEKLTQQVSSLQLQLKNAEKEQAKALTSPVSREPRNEAIATMAELKLELTGAQKALQNRENSVVRLEGELEELRKRLRSEEELQNRIEALQQSLHRLESENSGRQAAGQLIARFKDQQKRSRWLFVSVNGEPFHLAPELVKSAGIVSEEFALLRLNQADEPINLTSLENETKKEIVGFVKADQNGVFLISDQEDPLPVHIAIDDRNGDYPARGIFLGETGTREAGIYQLEPLKDQERSDYELLTASARQLKSFFAADHLDFDHFCTELEKLHVSFKIEDGQKIRFSRDYRQVLNGLRQRLPVLNFCDTQACTVKGRLAMLSRSCQAGQTCGVCGRVPKKEAAATHDFEGQRVLIFGGDRIGSEYERVLAQHNLTASWHSGFKNLAELKSGLGKADAVAIVIRQISHTLLREIVPLAEKEKIPVVYCTRRGVTGVISHLADHFQVSGNKK